MDVKKSAMETTVAARLNDLVRERGQLLPALWRVMEEYRQLSPELLEAVSLFMDIPYAEVYGVASFYSLFENASGNTPMYVCTDVMCALQGAESLREATKANFGTKVTVHESACLGQCDYAPAVWSGSHVLRRATADDVTAAVEAITHE